MGWEFSSVHNAFLIFEWKLVIHFLLLALELSRIWKALTLTIFLTSIRFKEFIFIIITLEIIEFKKIVWGNSIVNLLRFLEQVHETVRYPGGNVYSVIRFERVPREIDYILDIIKVSVNWWSWKSPLLSVGFREI